MASLARDRRAPHTTVLSSSSEYLDVLRATLLDDDDDDDIDDDDVEYTFTTLDNNLDATYERIDNVIDAQQAKQRAYRRAEQDIVAAKLRRGGDSTTMSDFDLEAIDFDAVWARDPRTCLILDARDATTAFYTSHALRNLFMNGRHHYLHTFVHVRDTSALHRTMRTQVDYWALFDNESVNKCRAFFAQLTSLCNSASIFSTIIDKTTRDDGCLVVDTRALPPKLEETFFWYRATAKPNRLHGGAPALTTTH